MLFGPGVCELYKAGHSPLSMNDTCRVLSYHRLLLHRLEARAAVLDVLATINFAYRNDRALFSSSNRLAPNIGVSLLEEYSEGTR